MARAASVVASVVAFFRLVAVALTALVLFCCSGDSAPREQERAQTSETKQALAVSEWPSQMLLATSSIQLEDRARITGNIAVRTASSAPLSSNAELVLGADSVVTGSVQADTLILRERSLVTGTAKYNSVQNSGAIQGGGSSPLSLPLAVTIPALPSITPGSLNVTLANSQQQTLPAGTYGDITLSNGNGGVVTKLSLSGLYHVKSLTLLNDAAVECTSECEIRVQQRVSIGDRSAVGPKNGVAALVQLLVGGSNGASGPLGTPAAVFLGDDAKLGAYVLAPNGTVRLGRSIVRGKVVARDILVGADTDAQGIQFPLIVTAPQSLTVRELASATFTVVASGSGLSFQWQKNGVSIAGATAASYTIAAAPLSDSGKQFRVVVSNAAGSVTSSAATLTVTPCASSDTSCNGVDDDCSGQIDEDFSPQCSAAGAAPAVLTCDNGNIATAPCSDGNACNGTEACQAATCVAGTPPVVDDNNPCTADSCSSGSGVSHTPVAQGTACGGSNVCNAAGQCGASPGPPGTTLTFRIKLPSGVEREQVALGATGGRIKVEDHARVLSSDGFAAVSSVDGPSFCSVTLGDYAETGTVWTEGKATLESHAHVYGDLFSDGIIKASSAVIDGVKDTDADLQPLEVIEWSTFFPSQTLGSELLAVGETRALAPGAYADVKVPSGARLKVSWGTYTLKSLTIESGGTLEVDNSQSAAFLYIKEGLSFNGSIVRTAESANVLFAVAGASDLFVKKAFTGLLVAPNAHVILKKPSSGEHRGSFFGKSVTLEDYANVRHEPFDSAPFCPAASTSSCGGLCPCTEGGACLNDTQCSSSLTCNAEGLCSCQPSCEDKECGDAPGDSCGGLCQDYCPLLAFGCASSIECAGDSICFAETCVPASCATATCDPSECGGVCGECVAECIERECGPDPICGTSCGECTGDNVCLEGTCATPEEANPAFPPHAGVQASASDIGTLPGQFSVSASGRANYHLPIDAPMGRGGVRPSFSLTYTGSSSPGIVGAGWALGGLSAIARCKKTLAIDGWPGAIEGRDNAADPADRDAVCLDGQRLVLVAGEHLRDGARYRTETESFRDVTYRGQGLTSSWEVRSKDGSLSRYGTQMTWGMKGAEGDAILSWPLAEMLNRSGVAIKYVNVCHGQLQGSRCDSEPLLSFASYGGRSESVGPDFVNFHRVSFGYEPRDEVYVGSAIAPGTRSVLSERLATISVTSNASALALRKYRLTYFDVAERSDFLLRVTECANGPSGEQCLAPTVFTYANDSVSPSGPADDFEVEQEQTMSWPSTFGGGRLEKNDGDKVNQAKAKPTLMLDFNGDGRPDFIHPDLDNHWALSLGVASNDVLFDGPYPISTDLHCMAAGSVADFNGDGKSDILEGCPISGSFSIQLSTGNPENPFTQFFTPSTVNDTAVSLDVNADGIHELITCTPAPGLPNDADSILWQNAGTVGLPMFTQVATLPRRDPEGGLNGLNPWCVGKPSGQNDARYPALMADLDANGTQDLISPGYVAQNSAAPWQFLSIGPGFESAWKPVAAEGLPDGLLSLRVLDVNGDGLQDHLVNLPFHPTEGTRVPLSEVGGRYPAKDLAYKTTLYLNSVDGTMTPVQLFLPRIEEGLESVTATDAPLGSGVTLDVFNRLRVIDFDRDGRDELMGAVKTPAGYKWYVLQNAEPEELLPRSTVLFRARQVRGLTNEDRFTKNGIAPFVADFDGDSIQDLLMYSVTDSTLRLQRGRQPERFLLASVLDGLGNGLNVGYSTHTYAGGVDCGPHARCLPNAGPLVSTVTSRDANGTEDGSTFYSYIDGRVGRYGRGPLGFRQRFFIDLDRNGQIVRHVLEDYDNGQEFDEATQRFPFAGLLTKSLTLTRGVPSGLSEAGSELAITTFKTVVAHAYQSKLSDAGLPFVVPAVSLTDQFQVIEGQEVLLSRNVVSRSPQFYDMYGNQQEQIVTAFDGDGQPVEETRTVNLYYPRGQRNEAGPGDPARWEVGLLRQRFVENRDKVRVLSFEYDEETGLLTRRVREPGSPAFEQVAELAYDDVGNVVQAREQADGIIKDTVLEYDAINLRLAAVTGPSGLRALVQVDRATGQLLTELDPNGTAVQHIYDTFGREVQTVTPTGIAESVLHSSSEPGAAYQVISRQRDALASTGSVADFDSKGRLLVTRSTGLGRVTVEQRQTYNDLGLLETQELPHPIDEPATGVTEYSYDALGSVRSITSPGDEGEPSSVTQFEYATRYTAPADLPEQEPGQPQVVFIARKIDADGHVSTSYSGALQQALVRTQGEGPDVEEARMKYGAFGDVAEYAGTNNVMTIARDRWGRVTSVSDSDIGTLSYSYDAFDRLSRATDADGTETHYEYDVLDRLLHVVYASEEERFIFDRDFEAEAQGAPMADNALGRLLRSVRTTPNGTFTQSFRYEAKPPGGNALQNRALLESVELTTPGQTFESRYEYYSNTARIAVQHYPEAGNSGAFAIRYCYDERGAVTHVFNAFDAVDCATPDATSNAPYWKRTSIFRGMGVNGFALGNDVTTNVEFDPVTTRLKGHAIVGAESSINFAYDYQAGGRLERETRTGTAAVGSVAFDRAYNYSGNGLLSSVTNGTTNEAIYSPTYTADQQLATGPSTLGTFVYDSADGSPFGNRLKRVDPSPSHPEEAPHLFEYDGRGNQNHRQGPRIPGGEQSISYNVFNLPDTISTGEGSSAFTVAFDYDASGQRIHTLRPDAETWHFGGIFEREERNSDPDIAEDQRFYIYAGGQRVAEVSRARAPLSGAFVESTRYFHYDRVGSVIAMSDSAGTLTNELDYDTYGTPQQTLPTAFGYTGHRHEQDLGLIDAGGRFYDPLFGVFLSADPISPLGGSSPRMNRYAYVGYDPVNFVDPSGLFLEDVWNKVTNFAGQVWGNVYVAPINLVLTGRWQTSWDTDTTEALITALAATAAGLACGAASAGNLAIAGACAGAVGGGGGALSSGGSGGDVFFAASIGALFGMYGGAAGMFANNAVYASTQSHIAASLSAAGATSGTSVGLQLATGQDVNWAQVAANGAVSGLLAWHKGAQMEAQSEKVGTAAGKAYGETSHLEHSPGLSSDGAAARLGFNRVSSLTPERVAGFTNFGANPNGDYTGGGGGLGLGLARGSRGLRLPNTASATLYRTVGEVERVAIEQHLRYTVQRGGVEGKYFYPTIEQAARLARANYTTQGVQTLTSVNVSNALLQRAQILNVATEGRVIFLNPAQAAELGAPNVFLYYPIRGL